MEHMVNKSISAVAGRIFLYVLALAGVAFVIGSEAIGSEPTAQIYKENSPTEYLQVTFLFLSVCIFLFIGLQNEKRKALGILLAGIAGLGFVRELDYFLETYIYDGTWKVLALLVLAVTAIQVYRFRENLRSALIEFINQPSFGIMVSGFLVVFAFSRIFGRGVFWQAVMADNYMRRVKDAAEEGIELLGYTLIFLSALELLIFCISAAKASQKPA